MKKKTQNVDENVVFLMLLVFIEFQKSQSSTQMLTQLLCIWRLNLKEEAALIAIAFTCAML